MKDSKKKERRRATERASPAKWRQIRKRAEELAMNQGKRAEDVQEKELKRAKREMLGLQTLPDPERPGQENR